MRRMTTPEDVAKAVRFLCSDDAEMIHEHTLVVDGGLSARWLEASDRAGSPTNKTYIDCQQVSKSHGTRAGLSWAVPIGKPEPRPVGRQRKSKLHSGFDTRQR